MSGSRATDRVVRGIGLMIGFTILAPMMDALAKLATDYVPAAEVALARFAVQGALLLPVVLLLGQVRRLPLSEMGLHALRGVCIAAATIAFMEALRHLPLADALAIAYVEPLVLTLLGAVFLGETIGPRRLAACGAGFIGVLLVVQPSFVALGWVALLPLVTAVTFAVYVLLTRVLSGRETPLVLQAYSGVAGAVIVGLVLLAGEGTGSAVFDPVWPPLPGALLMLAVGAMATCSHLCLTFALRLAPAATLAPIGYFEIVMATILGLVVFGDFPGPLPWLGICIIVGAGLFVLWRERQEELRARGAARLPPGPDGAVPPL